MDQLLDITAKHGPWTVLVIVVGYVLLKGSVTFEYPRRRRRVSPHSSTSLEHRSDTD